MNELGFTLADMVNAPTEFELDGEKFYVREPGSDHQGEYQRWLEQVAFDGINRRTYQDDEEKFQCLRLHGQDCASGIYEWGGEICRKRLLTVKGYAKFLEIVCREQGMTLEKAERLIKQEDARLTTALVSRIQSDPKVREAVRVIVELLNSLSSSSSQTPRSDTPSTTSDASPTPSS